MPNRDRGSSRAYYGRRRTVEDVTRKSKESGGVYDSYIDTSLPSLKVKEGENTFRILPPSWGGLNLSEAAREKLPEAEAAILQEEFERWGDGWEIAIFLHYNVGPNEGAYLCSERMTGAPCPICAAQRSARDSDERDALTPTRRALAWAIDRDNENAGPQIWAVPWTLRNEILSRSIDKRSGEVLPIDSPEDGFDVIFDRRGTDQRTKYTGVEIERDPTPICDDPDLQDRWLDFVDDHPLPSVLVFYPADYLENILYGQAAADDDAPRVRHSRRGEEEEEPKARRGRGRDSEDEPKRSRRSRDTEDERPRGRRLSDDVEEEEEPRRGRGEEPRRGRLSDDAEEPRARPSRRGGDREREEDSPPRSRRGQRVSEEEEEPRRGRDREEEPDPAEEDKPVGRRRLNTEPEEEEEVSEPARGAREQLSRLRRRRGE